MTIFRFSAALLMIAAACSQESSGGNEVQAAYLDGTMRAALHREDGGKAFRRLAIEHQKSWKEWLSELVKEGFTIRTTTRDGSVFVDGQIPPTGPNSKPVHLFLSSSGYVDVSIGDGEEK